ncbi:hypothetical protein CH063_09321 [Colletotrichum higginsianum]|uniref:Uncharacterized protein n=1 Tax=Colletotrichum higginsianum (strain IMI 349063) TaxID=759273 RepID=H1VD62_COLHI|nr:hypothetical protein CH063_09321 [Colletotrichum higginsianum]
MHTSSSVPPPFATENPGPKPARRTEHDDTRSRSASSGPSTTGAASWRTSPSMPPPESPAASSRFHSYDPTTPPPYRRFHHRDTPAYVLGPPSPSVSSSSEEITDGAPARPSLTVSRQRRRSVPSSSPHPYTFTPVPFCLDRRARYSGRSVGAGFVGPEDPYLAVGTLRHPQCRCRE